jgi:Carboxypeptidase regulatory-like domain/TonB dependent receptor-like, beta-barrel
MNHAKPINCSKRPVDHLIYGIISLALYFLLAPSTAFAQFTSNVRGVVTDVTGAVIPNASLTLENEKTGTKLTGVSDGSGNYRFNSLAPGTFRITATAAGFGTKTIETVLTTEQTAGVDFKLTPGTTTETVNVSSTSGPLLNPDETRLQTTVVKKQLDELPLQNRNIYSIVTIAPGVTGFANSGSTDDFANENRVQASANGHYASANQYVLDGFSITSAIVGGTANIAPNPDSVQEAALQTNTFAVDQGQGSSVQVELTTLSGTNAFHGAINYQYSDNNLTRFGYFQKAYNPFRRHDVSVAVGGPIWKDHLFFFGSTEIKRRLIGASTGSLTAETPAFLAYGKSINPNGLGVKLLTQYPAALVGTQTRLTSGQVLGCINGVNTDTGNLGCNIPFVVSGQNPRALPDNGRQYNFRVDGTTRSGKDRAYFNYYNTTNAAGVILARPGFDVTTTLTSYFLSANYTHTFGDRLINQASYAAYGIDGYQARGGDDYGVPVINITQISAPLGILNGPGLFEQRNYSGRDAVSYIRGKQSFRFGAAIRHENDKADFGVRLARPTFTFQTVQELLADNPLTENGVTFDPATGLQKLDRFGGQDTLFSFYASDDYKVTPRLLITFGVRYDDFGNVSPYGFDSYNQTANIVLGMGSDYVSQITGAHAVVGPGGVYNGRRSANFSPRGSFAYSPNPALSIRGGIGLYRDEIGLGQVVDKVNTNPPTFIQPTFDRRVASKPVFSVGTVKTVEVGTTTPNPLGFTFPVIPPTGVDAKGGFPGLNASVNAIDPNLKLPKSLNYVFGGEQSLGKSTVIGLSYSGAYLYDQLIGPNLNRVPGAFNIATGIKTLPNTSFGAINVVLNGGYGHYDALIATLRQRHGEWLSYDASYTWSHSRDTGIAGLRSTLSIGQDDYPDPSNLGRYYANSSFDTRNRVTISGYVKTPYKHHGYLLKQLLDDYELSTIAVGQSGQPYSVFNSAAYSVVNGVNVGGDYQAQGYNYAFPNQPTKNYTGQRSKAEYVNGIFAKTEFTAPPVGVFVQGTETRNHYLNPSLLNIDASIIKAFSGSLRDHVLTLKVRGDFYNVINRTNLTGITSDLSSSSFGRSTGNYQPRTIQLGGRIEF